MTLQMTATTPNSTFNCTSGTLYSQVNQSTTATAAWYTVFIDTVPGGDAVAPANRQQPASFSMEDKMLLLWAVLAVSVVAALVGYWYWQRRRRSADGGLMYANAVDNEQAAGETQQYRAMA